ncbi:unnamed protein product [Mytilus coruscus]|uniref:Uncharacterized protein n=1 Tax=Mytilus coruscus TaxID=42192 RepID=A0A6J8AIP3_MYTCO|nr:unnamed protein product [Mytilus coruscus]
MDELDLSNNFRHYGKYVITTDLLAFIGNIYVRKISLTGNGIRLIDAAALQKMKYKHCLENLNLNNNDFDYHQDWLIVDFNLFTNLRRVDFSSINGGFTNNIPIQKRYNKQCTLDHLDKSLFPIHTCNTDDIVIRFPSSLEFITASFIHCHTSSINSITFKGIKTLKMFDLTYSSFYDCNYYFYGLQNVRVLNMSHFKCSVLNPVLLRSGLNLEQLIMQRSSLSIGLKDDPHGKFLHGLKRLQFIDFSRNAFEDRFRISTF